MSPLPSARTVLCLLALLSSSSGGAGWAQDAAVTPGSRVRVWTELSDNGQPSGPQRTGQMAFWTADSLVLDLAGPRNQLAIPTTSVSRVDVSVPRTSGESARVRGGVGFLIGAVTGAILGYLQGGDPPLFGNEPFLFSANEKAVVGAVMLGGAGGIGGAIVGALYPGERWQRMPLPSGVSRAPVEEPGSTRSFPVLPGFTR